MTLTPEAMDTIAMFPLGFIATLSPGGRPCVSPKGTFVALDKTRLAFGEIRSPQTVANLSHSPECEVNFVDPFTRKGCRVRGAARIVRRDTEEFDRIYPQWSTLWGDLAKRIRVIVLIEVSACKPLSTPPYDDGATEEEMIALYQSKYAAIYP